jgi:hypothetical protein
MLHQLQVDLQETLNLSATDLLRLEAVWKLSAPNDGGTNNKLKPQRQFLENATDSLQSNIESLRVHFLPTRFPAAYTVDWTLPRQSTVHTKNRFAILDWNLKHGYAVIFKKNWINLAALLPMQLLIMEWKMHCIECNNNYVRRDVSRRRRCRNVLTLKVKDFFSWP